jgi:hypothetical protein
MGMVRQTQTILLETLILMDTQLLVVARARVAAEVQSLTLAAVAEGG